MNCARRCGPIILAVAVLLGACSSSEPPEPIVRGPLPGADADREALDRVRSDNHGQSSPDAAESAPATNAPKPITDLTSEERRAFLLLEAKGEPQEPSCTPKDVIFRYQFNDAAAGHRYAVIEVENISAQDCGLGFFPGMGVASTDGEPMSPRLEVSDRDISNEPVTPRAIVLSPGAKAFSEIEWTGELAGNWQPHLGAFAIQLAPGGDVAMYEPPEPIIDLGNGTTLRFTGWQQ